MEQPDAPIPLVTWDAWFADPALAPRHGAEPARTRLAAIHDLLDTFVLVVQDEQVELQPGLDRLCREQASELSVHQQAMTMVTMSVDALIDRFDLAAVARFLGRPAAELDGRRGEAVTLCGYEDRAHGVACLFEVESRPPRALVFAPSRALVEGEVTATPPPPRAITAVPEPVVPTPSAATRRQTPGEVDVQVATMRALAVLVDAIRRSDVASAGPILVALDERYARLPTAALVALAASTFADGLLGELTLHRLELPGDVARALLPTRLYDAVSEAQWKASRPDPSW